ncbi:hypothetical protein NMD10_27410 (plasmid) [Citrobacter portucalensis]|uniref:hypothetical protein n=1 Tax=Citrobacter portucalensis TaxID=1639133 RepID=UPI00351D2C0A
MSPLLIDEHEKILLWPDDLDEPGQNYQRLANLTDDVEEEHMVILDDDGEMARLYLRHVASGEISANFLLEFDLTAPEGFPERVPQVTSAFVNPDYRDAKLSQHVYRLVMGHYGVVVSDSHQTAGGMYIWLVMSRGHDVQINVMKVRGDQLEYRLSGDEPEVYCGQVELLEQAGNTIWGGPEEVIDEINLVRLGFRPTHQNMQHVVLAARPA